MSQDNEFDENFAKKLAAIEAEPYIAPPDGSPQKALRDKINANAEAWRPVLTDCEDLMAQCILSAMDIEGGKN